MYVGLKYHLCTLYKKQKKMKNYSARIKRFLERVQRRNLRDSWRFTRLLARYFHLKDKRTFFLLLVDLSFKFLCL